MGRVALVTGGSRGIGAAISKALKDAGYTVAANYAGNDEAAKKFTDETGIKTYKWSVADYDACKAGIAKVEADLGPVEVLVNNAGITRDALFHKMTPRAVEEVIDTNLHGVFNMTHPVWGGMRDRKFGRIVTISSINGQKGQFAQANYSASKAGDIGFTARAGAGGRAQQHHRQRGRARLHRHRDGDGDPREGPRVDHRRRSRSAGSARPTRSPAASSSSPPTTPASSPARRSRPTAASSSV